MASAVPDGKGDRGLGLSLAVRWLGLAILIAVLLNGAYSYLARIGVMEHRSYVEFVSAYCAPSQSTELRPVACWCMAEPAGGAGSAPSRDYLVDASGIRLLPKLAKEALFVAFIGFSLLFLRRRETFLPHWREYRPFALFAASLLLAMGLSLASHGPGYALLGLRPFEFLAIAFLGGWAATGFDGIARWLAWLLLAEVLLVAVEMAIGLPLSSCPHAFRAAGTLVLPNTLGMVAVGALAFALAFQPGRQYQAAMWVAAALLVVASGSGTGMVMMFALIALAAFRRVPTRLGRLTIATTILSGAMLAMALPAITQRPDIYDSLFADGGRVDKASQFVSENSPAQNLFGRGLGEGTNASANLTQVNAPGARKPITGEMPFYADSTVTFLIAQVGVVGLATFYFALALAWWRDRQARPFYLAIAIASLTLNIPEVFPLNFLLGLVIARTLTLRDREAAPT